MREGAVAIFLSAAFTVLMTACSVFVFKSYGGSLFFLTPFVAGCVLAFLLNSGRRSSYRELSSACLCTSLLLCGIVLLFALEGVLCIVMALPIMLVAMFAGAAFAHTVCRLRTKPDGLVVLGGALPALIGMESAVRTPRAREVATQVDVDAPPELVWKHVVSFSELPNPSAWFFRLGIAYPRRARIRGRGVGALRRCEFSTGAFIEPITHWEPPKRLAFSVAKQPPAMTELSPYRSLSTPHLDGYMKTERGEFRLIPLSGGRTRLEGSTWYTLDVHPASYWSISADFLLHAIHRRVLLHIKRLAEAGAGSQDEDSDHHPPRLIRNLKLP